MSIDMHSEMLRYLDGVFVYISLNLNALIKWTLNEMDRHCLNLNLVALKTILIIKAAAMQNVIKDAPYVIWSSVLSTRMDYVKIRAMQNASKVGGKEWTTSVVLVRSYWAYPFPLSKRLIAHISAPISPTYFTFHQSIWTILFVWHNFFFHIVFSFSKYPKTDL